MRQLGLSRREREVLALLDQGVKAKAIASRLGLTEATVRSYIRGALRKLGCHSQLEAIAVARRPGLLGERGRSGSPASSPRLHREGYRLLAEILATCLAESDQGDDRPQRAAEAWGRYLVSRPPLAMPLSAEESARELTAFLSSAGFQPQQVANGSGPVRIVLRACPFREVATAYRRVVCGVHRGIIRGALLELGGALEVGAMRPSPEQGSCSIDLVSAAERPTLAPTRLGHTDAKSRGSEDLRDLARTLSHVPAPLSRGEREEE